MKRRSSLWHFFLPTLLVALGIGLALTVPTVFAQQSTSQGLQAVGDVVNLPSTDPRIIIVRIINAALGLLGLIFLSLMLYAGFLWMTSGGNQEKIGKAQTTIRNALIGLIIILMSWAFTRYIITKFLEATQGQGGGTSISESAGGGGGGFGSSDRFSSFQVRSITPSGSVRLRNVRVRFVFSREVDAGAVNAGIHVYRMPGRIEISGARSVQGSIVEFVPSQSCPAGAQAGEGCFAANTDFLAVADRSLRSASQPGALPQRLACGGFAPVCETAFHTGDIIDTSAPSVSLTAPFDGQSVPQDDNVMLRASATDDSGISYVDLSVDGHSVGVDSPAATSTPTAFNAAVSWNTHGVATGTRTVAATAFDLDSHHTAAAPIHVMVRAAHCFNSRQDADEEAVDCGGSSCGACAGTICTSGSACASGVCGNSRCVEQPVITHISPSDGRPGTLITVEGENLTSRSSVYVSPGPSSGLSGSSGSAGSSPGSSGSSGSSSSSFSGSSSSRSGSSASTTFSGTSSSTSTSSSRTTTSTPSSITATSTITSSATRTTSSSTTTTEVSAATVRPEVRFYDGREVVLSGTTPSACGGVITWTSRRVVVEIPPGAQTGPIEVRNGTSGLSGASGDRPGTSIVVSSSTRPGLCGVEPVSGERGDVIEIVGAELGSTPGQVFFNNVDVTPSSFGFWRDTRVRMQVPVVTPGRYAVHVRVGDRDSNDVSFEVTEAVREAPIIQDVDPVNGPIGEYLTLTGRNFGTTTGRVRFINLRTRQTGEADVVFPAACAATFWQNTQVRVKVPARMGLSDPISPEAYQIVLTRQVDGAESNRMAFTVNTATPKPGICSITPSAGPIGTRLTVTGERFGSVPDTLSFSGASPSDRVNAAISGEATWAPASVVADVPEGAMSGPVRVTVGRQTSNGVNFTVRNCNEDARICGTETCCADTGQCSVGGVCTVAPSITHFSWRTSTGQIPIHPEVIEECQGAGRLPPSPSPWAERPGGDQVCVNAEAVLRFTTALDPRTITPTNLVVSKCTGTGTNPCTRKEAVTGSIEVSLAEGREARRSQLVVFRPTSGTWEADRTYVIDVRTAITSDTGVPMLERSSCGTGIGYCFRFKTRASVTPCRLGSASVTPNPYTAADLLETVSYRGNVLSAEDACVQINPVASSWRWYTGASASGPPDARATLAPDPACRAISPPTSVCPHLQIATAQAETGDRDPIHVNAAASNPGERPVVGTGLLYVRFVPPRVVRYGPNCNESCMQAKVWAEFNVPLDPAWATTQQVAIYRCVNQNCRAFDPPTPLEIAPSLVRLLPSRGSSGGHNRRLEVQPLTRLGVTYLETGHFYKVILKGDRVALPPAERVGIYSRTGLPLTDLNDRQGFAWIFRVKEDNHGLCDVTRVDVTPLEKIESVVGGRQLFQAEPVSVSQACGEQFLMDNGDYAWSTEHPDVARFMNARGEGVVDTTLLLPPNCSGRCLNTGSNGVAGRVADCNNGIVETTDIAYCRPRIAPSSCRWGDRSNPACVCRPEDTDCVVRADPTQACQVLPPGSSGGEECDLGADRNGVPGSACSAQCLWAGIVGGDCGNGRLDIGEQCDPGKVCLGGTRGRERCASDAECGTGTLCAIDTAREGCSDHCTALGAGSVTAPGEETTCGNGDLAAGETCDDGNTIGGDGCSPECVHEGSRVLAAVCGNGVPEPGESCERRSDGTWPAGCDHRTCLHTGTDACVSGPGGTTIGCCGNGTRENGEDCDDGNSVSGDGCSNRCLLEGSSIAYRPQPSFCGDGIPDPRSEQCEATRGDGQTDAQQLSQIVGEATPGSDGRMMSRLTATYQTKVGNAQHGLQCGFTREVECTDTAEGRTLTSHGLTTNGCCSERPRLRDDAQYPLADATGVCRNVQIYGTFTDLMDPSSLAPNFLITEEYLSGVCPTGTRSLSDTLRLSLPGWHGWVVRLWDRITNVFTPFAAQADPIECVGMVRGQFTTERDGRGTRAVFTLSEALRPNTRYRVVFRGDSDLTDSDRRGVRSSRGVVMAGDQGWRFTTGNRICTANEISLRDTHPDHPLLFQTPNEVHDYTAAVYSVQSGVRVPLSAVREYHWEWQPWTSSQRAVLQISDGSATVDPIAQRSTTSSVHSLNRNGSSFIFAGIRVDRDQVNIPSTSGTVLEASRLSNVILCERPWPKEDPRYGGALTFADTELRDADPSALRGTIFERGPFYQFSSLYCMDAGLPGVAEDLPALTIHPVPTRSADTSRSILRQYLFTFEGTDVLARLRKDGIGIRVLANPLHLSPLAWYQSQGFTGSPQATTVDGYEAIRDGNSLYVGARTVDSSTDGPVSSTIYLISVNPDAERETQEVYKQLVDNWTFNINMERESSNTCKTPAGTAFLERGRTIACTADWECISFNPTLHCASFKAKIQRDVKRLADFQFLMSRLEGAHQRNGIYPSVDNGSFVQGTAVSRWSSWQSTLGAAVGGGAPLDPVNRFLTCGQCQQGTVVGAPCVDDSDCTQGQTCVGITRGSGPSTYDPATCWNATDHRYLCPRLNDTALSRFYQYRAVDGGRGYELSTELEGPNFDRYRPALPTETRRCSNTGQLCQSDTDCRVVAAGTDRELSRGACQLNGGRWRYRDLCGARPGGVEYGMDAVCGNGVRGASEVCERGDVNQAPCTTSDGRAGTKQQICTDCQHFVDGPATRCLPVALCGNGRVDRYQCYTDTPDPVRGPGVRYGQSCTALTEGRSAECSDPLDPSGVLMRCVSVDRIAGAGAEEVCDDGALNGTYGHCNRTCGGMGGTCGDGELSPSERCDRGEDNGQYCDTRAVSEGGAACALASSCSFDCRDTAPHCGDRVVQTDAGEQCEGGTQESTDIKLCTSVVSGWDAHLHQPCVTNDDCGPGGLCGIAAWDQACRDRPPTDGSRCAGAGNVCEGDRNPCADDAECATRLAGRCVARHEINCALDNNCGPGGRCIVYPLRRVRSCTPPGSAVEGVSQCRWGGWSNCLPAGVCGDGVVDPGEECDDANQNDNDACTTQCKRNTCGDGFLRSGVEECDYGDPSIGGRNGRACRSEYGSSCVSCSTSCRVEGRSGAYCGDGIRNGSEICDGTSGISPILTCRSMGFDYPIRLRCSPYRFYTDATGRLRCVERGGENPAVEERDGARLIPNCDPLTDWVEHPASLPTETRILDPVYRLACRPMPAVSEGITCTPSCGLSGCGSCSDTVPSEEQTPIRGRVMDGGNPTIPVPGARVTLYYRGNRVAETLTGASAERVGMFEFRALNRRPECGQYRIVVDFMRDNPLTATVNEGRYGYYPFDSGAFAALRFTEVVPEGQIILRPRENGDTEGFSSGSLRPNETGIWVTWTGSLPLINTSADGTGLNYVRAMIPHLIVPESRGYLKQPAIAAAGAPVCHTSNITPDCSDRIRCNIIPGTFQFSCYQGEPRGVSGPWMSGDGDMCCPHVSRESNSHEIVDTLVENRIMSRSRITDRDIADRAIEACCFSPVTHPDPILVGFPTATRCDSHWCSSESDTLEECCRRDVGSGFTWHGLASDLTAVPGAYASCPAHRITTADQCTYLRSYPDRTGGGPTGLLTAAACNPSSVCDEFVRTSVTDNPMFVRYARPVDGTGVYAFYLEQRPYSQADLNGVRASVSTPARLMSTIGLRIVVRTSTTRFEITPPADPGITCASGQSPHLWLAFEQDARNGLITVPNENHGRFVCDVPAGMTGVDLVAGAGAFRPAGFPLPPLTP